MRTQNCNVQVVGSALAVVLLMAGASCSSNTNQLGESEEFSTPATEERATPSEQVPIQQDSVAQPEQDIQVSSDPVESIEKHENRQLVPTALSTVYKEEGY